MKKSLLKRFLHRNNKLFEFMNGKQPLLCSLKPMPT